MKLNKVTEELKDIKDDEELKKMIEKTSSVFDLREISREASRLLKTNVKDDTKENKLMFGQKKVSLMQIYKNLGTPVEYLFLVLAVIGSLGAGLGMPIMSYLTCDLINQVGLTGERTENSLLNQKQMIIDVDDAMNYQIKLFIIFGFVMYISNVLCTTFWSLVNLRMCYNLKKKYFTIMLKQEQGWFDANNPFEFSTKVQAQLEQVEAGIGDVVGSSIMMAAQCILSFVVAFIVSWRVTLVMLCITPFILLAMLFIVTNLRVGMIMGRRTWEKAGGMAEEILYNIKTVASFSNFEYEIRRFSEKVEVVFKLDLITTFKLALAIAILIFFLSSAFCISLFYGRFLIGRKYNHNKRRTFGGGDVMTAGMCTLMAVMGFGLVAPNIKTIQEACIATSDYFTLYEREPQMDYSQSSEKPDKESMKGRIEFKNVTFKYPSDPNQREILHGINLVFEEGKKVALVGESGCGKSTTVNLIERLYEATSGEILIDGMNIKKYDVNYLRSLIGYVQQEPVLFNKPIRENILFGREEEVAKLGDVHELIQEACNEAYATEFVKNLPDQLDYIVGIKGGKLSGGQKQRIAIARAILLKPKILILDEATSALDTKSEKEVQKALDNISKKQVTTIIIAHRLSTIKNADLIYAIKEGNIIEQGTHKELLAKDGYYAGLVRSQLAQDEIESKEAEEQAKAKQQGIKLERKNTEEEVQFEDQEDKLFIQEDTIKVNPCKIMKEVAKEEFRPLIRGCLFSCISGCIQPVNGLVQAYAFNAMLSNYQTVRYDEGLKYTWLTLVLAAVSAIANFFMILDLTRVGILLAKIYRKKILKKFLELHISFFDVNINSPGSLLTKLNIDTDQLGTLVNTIISSLVSAFSCAILGIILGCIYEWRVCLINFAFVPLICIAMITRRNVNKGNNRVGRKANVIAGGILSECVINTKTIYSFNFQDSAVELYLDALEYLRRQFTRDSVISGLLIGLGNAGLFFGQAVGMAASTYWIFGGSLTSENMNLAMDIVMMACQGVGSTMGQLGDLKKAKISFKSIYSTLDQESLIKPFKDQNKDKLSCENLKGKIELKNVYFAYPTRPENIILKDVSLTINPGEQAALVGYSGSGKSTVIQLLTRFYDVEDGKGEILIDDHNIKEYNLYELRKKIGLVSQEPCLFKRSVLENVRYGRLDATDEECVEAARQANIMKFFTGDRMHQILDNELEKKKSKGLSKHLSQKNEEEGEEKGEEVDKDGNKPLKKKKSSVGQKKDPVSGGEKQRLAIARAFVKNPTIILLDEATSALDKDSEKEVQKSLDKLSKNRTSIAIAHRLSTIEHCDKIFVLENGRLVEQGTHEELMALKNKYYTLHKYSEAD